MPTRNFRRFWSICGLKTDVIENTIVVDPSAIEKLPSELKERLASFLSTRELLSLAETSKSVSSDLNLSVASSPLTDRASQVKNYRTESGPQCFAVVIPDGLESNRAHSMTFTCNVETQYGSSGGSSIVQVLEQSLPVDPHQDTDNLLPQPHQMRTRQHRHGKLVAQSLTRQLSKLALSFPVKPNKFYQLYIDTHWCEEQFSKMSLHRVGMNNKAALKYTAYQFDAFEPSRLCVCTFGYDEEVYS